MNKSETVGELFKALSKTQAEIQNVHKDKQGHNYKYAELSSILDMARPIWTKNDLAIAQYCVNDVDHPEVVGVETIIGHLSGEWMSETYYSPASLGRGMSTSQAGGSVISYSRRYALAALLGIAQTDNDAQIEEEKPVALYPALLRLIKSRGLEGKIPAWLAHFKIEDLKDMHVYDMQKLINKIEVEQ